MNFGKLLAAGKSWMNGSAEISYRVDKQFYLPKFESPKNPLAHLPKAKTENVAPPKKEIVAVKIEKTPAISVAPKSRPAQPNWTTKLNPFSQSAPEPKNERPIVQSELSLDSVKVVHNDLSDADVEIVPMKSRPAPPELQPARKSWEILGERLLKSAAL
jgi:hypothetical protein